MSDNLHQINFFIPGAAKSGTSTLHSLLNEHPNINMSDNKEPHFFANRNFSAYTDDEKEHFLKNFDCEKDYKYRGESSTGYFYFDEFKTYLQGYANPETKLIFILRNPIDRTYSHYCYLKSLGSEDEVLKKAVLNNHLKEPNLDDLLPEHIVKNYYQYSLYGKWLQAFYEFWPKNQIKVVLFEDLKEDQLGTVNECLNFLGLENFDELPDLEENKTVKVRFSKLYKNLRVTAMGNNRTGQFVKHLFPKKWRRKYKNGITEGILKLLKTKESYAKLTASDRRWLKVLFKDDVAKLKTITQRDFKPWTDFDL